MPTSSNASWHRSVSATKTLIARPADIEELLQIGAKRRAIATPFLAELRAALVCAPCGGQDRLAEEGGQVRRVGRFVTFRGGRPFWIRRGRRARLLLSVPFASPQQATQWINVLKNWAIARPVVGRGDFELRRSEHLGGHTFARHGTAASVSPRARPRRCRPARRGVERLAGELAAVERGGGQPP